MVNPTKSLSDGHAATHGDAANNGEPHSYTAPEAGKKISGNYTQTTVAERRSRESENPNWLEKNIHALLALAIMFITFAMFVFVINASMNSTFKGSDAKDIVIYILGALTTVATQVVSFYFGSSSSSVDKGKTLSAIAKRG